MLFVLPKCKFWYGGEDLTRTKEVLSIASVTPKAVIIEETYGAHTEKFGFGVTINTK